MGVKPFITNLAANDRHRASDGSEGGVEGACASAKGDASSRKTKNTRQITLRLDPDILAHFRRLGKGYQTAVNAVLRRNVEAQQGTGTNLLKASR
jgi:uncharacterized protein (DUF4415 family)